MKLSFECTKDWNAMPETEGGRHCHDCDKTVVDVRDKTRREFNELRLASQHLCVRGRVDSASRELMFGGSIRRRLPLVANAAFALALAACGGSRNEEVVGSMPDPNYQPPPQEQPPSQQQPEQQPQPSVAPQTATKAPASK